jgi:hypothetical protein
MLLHKPPSKALKVLYKTWLGGKEPAAAAPAAAAPVIVLVMFGCSCHLVWHRQVLLAVAGPYKYVRWLLLAQTALELHTRVHTYACQAV